MMTPAKIRAWFRANCGAKCLAPLTSHDWEALLAALAICPLINWNGAPPQLFVAFHAVVIEMQPRCRWFAYHGIAMQLDWSHRSMIWARAGLPEGDKPAFKCKYES